MAPVTEQRGRRGRGRHGACSSPPWTSQRHRGDRRGREDEAPMLFNGEQVGSGSGAGLGRGRGPIDGTRRPCWALTTRSR
ncbi:hypothetical protein QJS66_08320 [Kocuria rhizophila]|nr:hypothetical protein QJS66_08320 [Kocuria rhizophila]